METLLASLAVIIAAATLAPIAVDFLPRIVVPVVVVEIVLGIIVGPQVLGWVELAPEVAELSEIGLAFLFFMAGFEIDFVRIAGRSLRLALIGWAISLALAFVVGGVFQAIGAAPSPLYIGLAISTTAIGTLMPILHDAGVLDSPLGTQTLAAGAVGEFGPIVMIALLLDTTRSGFRSALVLNLFVLVVLVGVFTARHWRPARLRRLVARTMHSSGQLGLRISIMLVVGFVFLTELLRLEFLLGAFAAGVIVAQLLRTAPAEMSHEVEALTTKFEGVGFGLLIPIFFIVSGVKFDLAALLGDPASLALVPVSLVLFLLVRGLPALALYGRVLERRNRIVLGVWSATQLPLVIAITEIAVEHGRMTRSLATALVGAGMLSVLVFPLLGLALRERGPALAPVAAESHRPA